MQRATNYNAITPEQWDAIREAANVCNTTPARMSDTPLVDRFGRKG